MILILVLYSNVGCFSPLFFWLHSFSLIVVKDEMSHAKKVNYIDFFWYSWQGNWHFGMWICCWMLRTTILFILLHSLSLQFHFLLADLYPLLVSSSLAKIYWFLWCARSKSRISNFDIAVQISHLLCWMH